MTRRASAALIAVAALALSPAAATPARRAVADYPSIYVTFLPTSTLRVVLADGTPLGTSSGPPTVLAPGTYNLLLDDSSLVSNVTFDLAGPNVKLVTNMSYGEETAESWVEGFLPNSTYTWRDDNSPANVYTFVTSNTPVTGSPGTGTAPPGTTISTTPIPSGTGGKASSTDVVGSGVAPLRGTLAGSVATSGTLTLTLVGRAVATHPLKAGKYVLKVTDRSRKQGFTLQEAGHRATTVTGVGFVGSHSVTLALTAGQWFYYGTFVSKKTYFVVENS